MGTPVTEVCSRIWLRPIIAMIPFAAATYAIERFWPAHHLTTFFAGVAVALPVAVAGAWLLALSPDDREAYLRMLRRALGQAPEHAR